ncbi:hypothetical protein Rs2_21581 [Raphanus sativus]|nr:hypothetical protein Rs2_21581 [Raphanus sativus]
MKQLEGSTDKLHDAESEITNLKHQIITLETTVARQKEESEQRLTELSKIEKEVDSLKNEPETKEKEKNRALYKEPDASLNVQRLLEQRKKLLADLETSKEEEEKGKKAMESLASALHEVSSKGRELKEKLLSQGGGDQEYETHIEDLKLVIKATREKYETMLDEARHEIDVLVSAVEQTKKHFESLKNEWEMKEANLVDYVKKMEEEESLEEAREESVRLKENLLEKETEFESVVHENEELRDKEDAALRKIEELSKLLYEARLTKREEVELSESETDCQIEKKEAVPDKKAELETEEVEEDSRKVDESDKASSAYVSFFSKKHPN